MDPMTDDNDISPDVIKPQTWDEVVLQNEGITQRGAGLSVVAKPLQSTNFIENEEGWRINSNGDAEFNSAALRESLTFAFTGQDYKIFSVDPTFLGADQLFFQSQTSGKDATIALYSYDGDGTDNVLMNFYPTEVPTGEQGFSTNKFLSIGYSDSGDYIISGDGEVTSLDVDLHISTSGDVIIDQPLFVPDDAYDSGWNGDLTVPTKNAVYDKIETLGEGTDYTSTQVTSLAGGEPTTWTDLNLSSIIGATTKIVLLKLVTITGRVFAFRTNGDTAEYYDDTAANSQNIIKTDDNLAGTVIVKTDSSGVIEWRGNTTTPGISFGNTTIDTDQVSGTTSHNNDGNFVFVAINSTTNDVTAMTYAGVAMTQLGTAYQTSWSSRYHSTWYIVNPATGANNVVTTGGANWQFVIFSASGVDVSNPVTGLTTGTDQSSANPTVSVTTTVDDAYAICVGQINDATVSGGTDTTLLVNGTGGSFYIFRSTADTDGAGAFTLNITSTGDWRLRGFGLNPARTTLTVLAAW